MNQPFYFNKKLRDSTLSLFFEGGRRLRRFLNPLWTKLHLTEWTLVVWSGGEWYMHSCISHLFSVKHNNLMTTFNGGSLGSCIDEERSQLRYVMWIAEFSESSNLWTQIALQVLLEHVCLSVILTHTQCTASLWVGSAAIASFYRACRAVKCGEYIQPWTVPTEPTAELYIGVAKQVFRGIATTSSRCLWEGLKDNAGRTETNTFNHDLRSVETTRWI